MDKISDEAIRERAHRIWIEEGMPQGKQDEHWERARRELEPEPLRPDRDDGAHGESEIKERAADRGAGAAITGVSLPSGRSK